MIEFRRQVVKSRMLDPRRDFDEEATDIELRVDPLTGRLVRVRDAGAFFPWRPASPPDYSDLIESSRKRGCPFCPELIEQVTPKFMADVVPEGRLRRGEATTFPNMVPYDKHCTVCVISHSHFLRPAEFSPQLLTDALLLSRDFSIRAHETDPTLIEFEIGWNYLPMGGSSVLHPHHQLFAGPVLGTRVSELLTSSRQYAAKDGRCYWADYVDAERRTGERFLATVGRTEWLMDFTPYGLIGDVVVLIRERSSILELTDEDVADLARGLSAALRYVDSLNIWSFNFGVYSAPSHNEDFWLQARLVHRLSPSAAFFVADYNWSQIIQRNPLVIHPPEIAASEARPFFAKLG